MLANAQFTKSPVVDASALAAQARMRPRVIVGLLSTLAAQVAPGSRLWRFRREDDDGFEKRFPADAEQARRWWAERDKQVSAVFAASAEAEAEAEAAAEAGAADAAEGDADGADDAGEEEAGGASYAPTASGRG